MGLHRVNVSVMVCQIFWNYISMF